MNRVNTFCRLANYCRIIVNSLANKRSYRGMSGSVRVLLNQRLILNGRCLSPVSTPTPSIDPIEKAPISNVYVRVDLMEMVTDPPTVSQREPTDDNRRANPVTIASQCRTMVSQRLTIASHRFTIDFGSNNRQT